MFVPVNISVGVGGSKTVYHRGPELVADQLRAFAGRALSFREPLTAIGEMLRGEVAGEFARQGTVAYGPWQPLSEPYGSWKASRAPGTPILVGIRPLSKGTRSHPTRPQTYAPSGRMRMQLLDAASTHVDSIRMAYTPESDIAGYHQTGTSRMPARPLVALTPAQLHEWDRAFVVYLNRIAGESFA